MNNIADIRREYQQHTLLESGVDPDPFKQFGTWWEEALRSEITEVNAMTLATASPDGHPLARIVLLKGYDPQGFVFFTNYESLKGLHLAANPRACLLFFWKELERQVRISGRVEKLSGDENDEYFGSRPESSQIGAWASPQSKPISNRDWLEANEVKYQLKYQGKPVPLPPHWGGYQVRPESIEFWQGRPSRLHDRILYTLQAHGQWTLGRLAP
jgi:pyridoxamine 5'-phosphate oxidase